MNAYIDGQLPHNRQRDIERLIATDDAVRVQVESLRRVRELVRLAAHEMQDSIIKRVGRVQ